MRFSFIVFGAACLVDLSNASSIEPHLGRSVDDRCLHGIASGDIIAFAPAPPTVTLGADVLEFALCDGTLSISNNHCSLEYSTISWFFQHTDWKKMAKDKQELVMKTIMDVVNSVVRTGKHYGFFLIDLENADDKTRKNESLTRTLCARVMERRQDIFTALDKVFLPRGL